MDFIFFTFTESLSFELKVTEKKYISQTFRKIITCLILFAFLTFDAECKAQDEHPCGLKINKKAIKLYEEAMKTLKYDKEEGYLLLSDAVEKDKEFVDAYFKLAEINMKKAELLKAEADNNYLHEMLNAFTRAEQNYLKVIEICPAFENHHSHFVLGEYYYNNENDYTKYNKSRTFLAEFVKNNDEKNPDFTKAKKLLKNCEEFDRIMNNPVPYDPKPVNGICSNTDEYLPLISPDGTLAFYTHRYTRLNKVTNAENFIEEFTVSEKVEDLKEGDTEKYTRTAPMPAPFNAGKNQGGVAISIDNNHILITICEMIETKKTPYTNCDIFQSDYVNGKWTTLKNLGPNVNGNSSWESQPTLSADGKTLYFSSDKKGGIGDKDIWKSELQADGVWGKAINLGSAINTKGEEKSPFIHTDSQTLYYSSNGLFGLGGYDIFYSKMNLDKTWTTPKNIGYPINTEGDDVGFIVSTNGSKAYFSSNRIKGVGGWDIFAFDLYPEARPKKVALIKGQAKDEKGDDLKDVKIELKNTKTNKVTEAMVDKITGKYAIAITLDDDKKDEFLMVVKKDGYAFTSEYIKPYEEEKKFEKTVTVDFDVKQVSVGETVKLNNIKFGSNSASFDEASRIVLNNFAEFLEENPKIKIAIYGHTDNVGNASSNMKLSDERAQAVYDYLRVSGIAENRMKYKGFGQTKPIATNDTPDGRAQNRRTEFLITGK